MQSGVSAFIVYVKEENDLGGDQVLCQRHLTNCTLPAVQNTLILKMAVSSSSKAFN